MEDRRYLTWFVTHEGVNRFRTLPFGLASLPSAFHQFIRKILDGLEGCACILDDILIFSRTVAVHDERLPRVRYRLAKYNARVRQDKCVIGVPEVGFNGHHRFTLVTDHQTLKTLLTAGGTGHSPLRLHRWVDRLFQYTFLVMWTDLVSRTSLPIVFHGHSSRQRVRQSFRSVNPATTSKTMRTSQIRNPDDLRQFGDFRGDTGNDG